MLDGREIKCEVVNDEIQVDESTKQLWIKETNSEIEEYIVYLKIGDVYREHRNYAKSLEYYNKSLEIYPNYIEAINNNTKHFFRFCITKLKIVVSHVEFCECKYNKIFIFTGCS